MKNRAEISFKWKVFIDFVLLVFAIISITSFYLILSNAFGYYQEGIMGFICDCVFRVFITIVISLVLAFRFILRIVRNLLLYGGFVLYFLGLDFFIY